MDQWLGYNIHVTEPTVRRHGGLPPPTGQRTAVLAIGFGCEGGKSSKGRFEGVPEPGNEGEKVPGVHDTPHIARVPPHGS